MNHLFIIGALVILVGFMVGYGYRPKRNLHFLIIKLNQMGEALDNAVAKVDLLESRLTGIQNDINFIKSKLPTSGGMTAEEVAVLNTRLDAALARATDIDAQTDSTTTPS